MLNPTLIPKPSTIKLPDNASILIIKASSLQGTNASKAFPRTFAAMATAAVEGPRIPKKGAEA